MMIDEYRCRGFDDRSVTFGSNQARMHRLPSLTDGLSMIAYAAPVEAKVLA
jgi:hypothetical protein